MGNRERTNEIQRSGRHVVRRLWDDEASARISKQVLLDVPDPAAALTRLRHEFEVLSHLNVPGVVRALGWQETAKGPVLWLEDAGPWDLKQRLGGKPLAVPEFLRLAIQLTEGLAGLHGRGFIHGDLSPGNVVVDVVDGERLTLIDLETAAAVAPAAPVESVPADPDTELLYVSPEQTGRMNRPVDRRADLYSLGAIFYEMLTGTPPFPIGDPVELVHAHLARSPRPLPGAAAPGLISDLVLRLLAKTPERRYQSAAGLLWDLREAASRLDASGSLAPFELGQADLGPDPRGLYGREREMEQLRAAWERTRASGREVVIVSGEAGSGKTELLRGLQGVVIAAGGRFASGKADLRRSSAPYGPIVDALRAVVIELLQGPPAEANAVRARVAQDLPAGVGALIALVPELESLVGPSPAPPASSPREAEGRFLTTFTGIVGALAVEDHPLVLCLDDVQWADSASTTLIRRLAAADLPYFLLLLARRDEGPGPVAALVDPEGLREAGTRLSLLALAPLSLTALIAMCQDLLGSEESRVRPLAELLAGKSGGNPLFFRRLLRRLQQDELVLRDAASNAWTWDLDRIATVGVTDNVGELMAEGLRRLGPEARALLATGACLGGTFELGLVAEAQAMTREASVAAAREAADAGQVLALDRSPRGPRPEDRFQFAHDRIQQAAEGLLSAERRTALHLRLGRLLLARQAAQPEGQLLAIVDQLNLGADLITDRAERLRLAALGLQAESGARAASAFGPALEYCKRALQLLPADAWESEYSLAFALHRDAIECAFWTGEGPLGERLFEVALAHARDRLDRARLYCLRVNAAFAATDFAAGIRRGREGLALLGVELPADDDMAAAEAELAEAERRLEARPFPDLLNGPLIRAPELLACMDILAPLQTAAYYLWPSLWVFTVARMVNLTLEHGLAPPAAQAFVSMGAVQLIKKDRPARAYEVGRLGLEIARRTGDRVAEVRANVVFAAMLKMWGEPFDETISAVQRVHGPAIETGELMYAFANMVTAATTLFHRGAELARVEAQIDATMRLAIPGLSNVEQDRMIGLREVVHRLEGIPGSGHQTPDGSAELVVASLLGELPWARALADAPGQGGPVTREVHVVDRCFHAALTYAALHEHAPADERPGLLAAVAAAQARFEGWAAGCPDNFGHKAVLLAAERARLESRPLDAADLYERAAALAAANRFLQDEGLANELAARFHRAEERPHFAQLYAGRALAAYARWGARAKVAQLQDQFPAIATEPATGQGGGATIDLLALLRAAEALSREVVLERLCSKLIEVCLAIAGAERAVLVLIDDDGAHVRAVGTVQGTTESLRQPLAATAKAPVAIITRALHTGEPLVLADALHHPELGADPFVAAHGVRSALALPILHQGKLVGALYLENNLATRVFVPERVRLLQLLSAQIATSLQNSQLFERLTGEVEERKRAEAAVRFLSEAGVALSESLDYQATLAKAARLAVPALADGCLVYVLEEDKVRVTAAAHREPGRQDRLAALMRDPPEVSPLLAQRLLAQTTAAIVTLTPGGQERHSLEEVLLEPPRPGVGMTVPLVVHDRRVAVMSMVLAPDRPAGARELALAEELARRAAVAIENARLYGQAQETIRIRDEFLAIASHELRTPLASLRLMIDGFAQDVLSGSPQATKGAAIISRQTRRLESLVGDLLDVTGILSGRFPVQREAVDLALLIRQVAERLAPQLEAGRYSLTVETPPTLAGRWNWARLDQVLTHLLANAIKFGAGRPLSINASVESGVARVEVVDHGIGIPRERLPHIFGRFERAASYHYGGLGLGLYIAHEIVSAMGGRLSVASTVGAGSTFTVELPTSVSPDLGGEVADRLHS
jgi:predicted ATPase/signal transduction histidine kinase